MVEEPRATAIREIAISCSISFISLENDIPPERLNGFATGEPFSLRMTSSGRICRGYNGSGPFILGSNVSEVWGKRGVCGAGACVDGDLECLDLFGECEANEGNWVVLKARWRAEGAPVIAWLRGPGVPDDVFAGFRGEADA